jgi:hypothetical protein
MALGHQIVESIDAILAHRAEQVDGEEEVRCGDTAPPFSMQVIWYLAQQRGPATFTQLGNTCIAIIKVIVSRD